MHVVKSSFSSVSFNYFCFININRDPKGKNIQGVYFCSTFGHIAITLSTYVFLGYETPFAMYVYLLLRNTAHIASCNVIFSSQISMAYNGQKSYYTYQNYGTGFILTKILWNAFINTLPNNKVGFQKVMSI